MTTDLLLNIKEEFKTLIPPLSKEEREGLEQSIIQEGNRIPIDTWHGYIVDGHNRYDICHAHNIPLKAPHELSHLQTIEDVKIWIINNQLSRRNLPMPDRIELSAKKLEYQAQKEANTRKIEGNKLGAKITNSGERSPQIIGESDKHDQEVDAIIARAAGTSRETVRKYRHIQAKATPEQKEKLKKGKATIGQVFADIKRNDAKEAVKKVEWPEGKYRILYADPPWKYSNYSNSEPEHQVTQEQHYPVMTPDEIASLPVKELALDNAVLFIWSTSPILEDVFKVINAWGFKYKASFIWDKVKHNMGHYNSVRHEFLLIAVKGSCQPDNIELVDSVQSIERTGHSEKPEFFREVIQKLYPHGPRIELFARKKVDGWETYGNQIDA